MPACQILSSPPVHFLQRWWLLIPAVTLQVCFSCSLYPQSLLLPWMLFSCGSQTLTVSVLVPQAVSPSVFLQPFPPACRFRCLSSLHSHHTASSSCWLSTAERVTESRKETASCLSGLVPAPPRSPCLLSTLPSTWNHGKQRLNARISFSSGSPSWKDPGQLLGGDGRCPEGGGKSCEGEICLVILWWWGIGLEDLKRCEGVFV